MTPRDQILDLKERMSRSIIGQEAIVERLLIGLLANGNLLVEGLPGLAKTRAIKSLASNLEAVFSRIQFTPDLLPSDITGTEVYYSEKGSGHFRFDPGPIFANMVLADEINRAPAKVQAALLEAMEERQVTVAGTTHKLPDLFMVMATQNPIEQEGTYPLPEAQMDRFLMHVYIGYPDEAAEVQIVDLVRREQRTKPVSKSASTKQPKASKNANRNDLVSQDVIFDARREIDEVYVSSAIDRYIVDLVFATRFAERFSEDLGKMIQVGASPRGSIGLEKCARVHAWLAGQDHVSPDNVRAIVNDVLRHRIILSYDAIAEGKSADDIILALVELVAVE